MKNGCEEKEWFEFEKDGFAVAVRREAVSGIAIIPNEVRFTVAFSVIGGNNEALTGDQARELLEFVGLRHLIKYDNEL